MVLAIDSSGLHPSTEACLEALEKLQKTCHFAKILDMGCGSGILSLAAAHIWNAQLVAVDISENALIEAGRAVREHDMEQHITLLRSDRFAHPGIREHGPYDLIIANMLAQTQMEMARDIKNNLKTGGYCIIAGILAWLADGVEQAFTSLGFEIVDKIVISIWHCYTLCDSTETIILPSVTKA